MFRQQNTFSCAFSKAKSHLNVLFVHIAHTQNYKKYKMPDKILETQSTVIEQFSTSMLYVTLPVNIYRLRRLKLNCT